MKGVFDEVQGSRWIEWRVLNAHKNQLVVSLIDGLSGAQLGRAYIIESKRDIHISLFLLHGLLNKTYSMNLDEGEGLRPDHFESLVGDVEKVLPGLSGDVVISLLQAINAGRMFDSLESLRNGRGRGVER
jgi:hypothetical protein